MSDSSTLDIINTQKWIDEYSKSFQPPVCNKLMHNGQLKVFFVGGPNVRKDYHIEEGPEFFYMIKGDMCLKVVEQNKHRDVHIKEGQVFFLPPRVPHSPQRNADTIGLVIERKRDEHEMDGLRYFVEENGLKTTNILYEKWFHCVDLGPQLAGVIKEFFATEQFKTGKPHPDFVSTPPIKINENVRLNDPFYLQDWIKEHLVSKPDLCKKDLFINSVQSQIWVYGQGEHPEDSGMSEVWMWQLSGTSNISVGTNNKLYLLTEHCSLLLPPNTKYEVLVHADSHMLSVAQNRAFVSTHR